MRQIGNATIYQGDCLQIMPELAAGSVDLIAVDPPYFRVKSDSWDRQWDSPKVFLAWVSEWLAEFARILKPNGSLYLFASPQMAAQVQLEVAKQFHVLNEIVWVKRLARHKAAGAESLRGYFPQTERIIFAEQRGQAGDWNLTKDALRGDVFAPIRCWLKSEFDKAEWKLDDLNRICGTASMAGRHYTARSQWALPTQAHYLKLQAAAPFGVLQREYESLRREYESLRRFFDIPHMDAGTDVWDFDAVPFRFGKHPCQKPEALMSRIIKHSCPVSGVVLDCFAGSFTTGVAAIRTGRKFIGIEQDADYFCVGAKRISDAVGIGTLFEANETDVDAPETACGDLFAESE